MRCRGGRAARTRASCGELLLVGGGPGMPGAIRLAAEAALRVGAGLVYVATHRDSVASVMAGRPEIICHSVASGAELEELARDVDGLVVGPGLGQSAWAYGLWRRLVRMDVPLVLDADGLNLLAPSRSSATAWLLTPHPGEAARLVSGASVESIQRDRLAAARAIAERYGAITVLKGPNTLVARRAAASRSACAIAVTPAWQRAARATFSPARSAELLVQTGNLEQTARAGVLLHALAGDDAAKAGERGTVAGDLLPHLRAWANPS